VISLVPPQRNTFIPQMIPVMPLAPLLLLSFLLETISSVNSLVRRLKLFISTDHAAILATFLTNIEENLIAISVIILVPEPQPSIIMVPAYLLACILLSPTPSTVKNTASSLVKKMSSFITIKPVQLNALFL
jgi:hypothetical protein